MTAHAEVRETVAEMNSELVRIQEAIPASTFLTAALARRCLQGGQYAEAADHARAVLATLRGVPTGAVELGSYSTSVLIALTGESREATRGNFHPSDGAEQRRSRERLLAALEELHALLNDAEAVYIVPREKVDA